MIHLHCISEFLFLNLLRRILIGELRLDKVNDLQRPRNAMILAHGILLLQWLLLQIGLLALVLLDDHLEVLLRLDAGDVVGVAYVELLDPRPRLLLDDHHLEVLVRVKKSPRVDLPYEHLLVLVLFVRLAAAVFELMVRGLLQRHMLVGSQHNDHEE